MLAMSSQNITYVKLRFHSRVGVRGQGQTLMPPPHKLPKNLLTRCRGASLLESYDSFGSCLQYRANRCGGKLAYVLDVGLAATGPADG